LGQSIEEYVTFLEGKGFSFGKADIGFIYFGKQYASASDFLVNTAIEITLKAQRKFDGSFYISLLENFKKQNIQTRIEVEQFVKEHGLLQ